MRGESATYDFKKRHSCKCGVNCKSPGTDWTVIPHSCISWNITNHLFTAISRLSCISCNTTEKHPVCNSSRIINLQIFSRTSSSFQILSASTTAAMRHTKLQILCLLPLQKDKTSACFDGKGTLLTHKLLRLHKIVRLFDKINLLFATSHLIYCASGSLVMKHCFATSVPGYSISNCTSWRLPMWHEEDNCRCHRKVPKEVWSC